MMSRHTSKFNGAKIILIGPGDPDLSSGLLWNRFWEKLIDSILTNKEHLYHKHVKEIGTF